jgi:hypothetical protein
MRSPLGGPNRALHRVDTAKYSGLAITMALTLGAVWRSGKPRGSIIGLLGLDLAAFDPEPPGEDVARVAAPKAGNRPAAPARGQHRSGSWAGPANGWSRSRALPGGDPGGSCAARDLHALTPLIWEHVNPYGRFELDMDSRISALH